MKRCGKRHWPCWFFYKCSRRLNHKGRHSDERRHGLEAIWVNSKSGIEEEGWVYLEFEDGPEDADSA